MPASVYDLAIVGGGINGAGIARDAAGRGLKVFLAEQEDLAGATSSASSKLIHGGLRYLEQWHFRLVRESLQEREVLLRIAPHIIHPLRFVLPYVPGMRSKGLIRLGLAPYDRLSERHRIPASCAVDLARDPAGRALKSSLDSGFAYYDCWVDDARLVVLNARDAADRGAEIATPTRRRRSTKPSEGLWSVSLATGSGKRIVFARATRQCGRSLGRSGRAHDGGRNERGPGVEAEARQRQPHRRAAHSRRRGCLPSAKSPTSAWCLRSAIEGRFTMIGTTDVAITRRSSGCGIERRRRGLSAGVGEPLFCPVAHARGHRLALRRRSSAHRRRQGQRLGRLARVPSQSLRAGRSATVAQRHRRQDHHVSASRRGGALEARARISRRCAVNGPRAHVLPGGDVGRGGLEAYRLDLARRRPGLYAALLTRLARLYGTRADAASRRRQDAGGSRRRARR